MPATWRQPIVDSLLIVEWLALENKFRSPASKQPALLSILYYHVAGKSSIQSLAVVHFTKSKLHSNGLVIECTPVCALKWTKTNTLLSVSRVAFYVRKICFASETSCCAWSFTIESEQASSVRIISNKMFCSRTAVNSATRGHRRLCFVYLVCLKRNLRFTKWSFHIASPLGCGNTESKSTSVVYNSTWFWE